MAKEAQSVLFVSTSFPRFSGDFAGSFIFRMAKYLVRDGLQVTALAPGAVGYQSIDTLDGVQIYRYPYFYPQHLQSLAYEGGGILANIRNSWLNKLQIPLFFLATVWAIKRYQDHFDLIHCHWLPTAIAALIARPFSRTKPAIIFTNWGSDTRLLPRWLTRWTVARVEGCISTAIETDEHLIAAGRTEFRRIMAPVDEDRFTRNTVPSGIRDELVINIKTIVLLFLSRLNYFKDPLTFIRACAILKQQGYSFVSPIAGDGDLMSDCQVEIKQLALQDRILFLGMRSDPEKLLNIATAMVHVSPVENTWANSIAEAMFIGVPVVLSDAGYTQRTFTHQQDCLIVPAQNPDALADALKRLIDNQSLRIKLIKGAKELLRKHKKNSASIVPEIRTYYNEILRQKLQEQP